MTVAEDMSPQPYHTDWPVNDSKFPPHSFVKILANYDDPNLWSGSVLDFNIDENFGE